MFEGFEQKRVEANGIAINLRIGGSGPPLLLLHGNPLTHVMWHKIAPRLARTSPWWRATCAATATATSRGAPPTICRWADRGDCRHAGYDFGHPQHVGLRVLRRATRRKLVCRLTGCGVSALPSPSRTPCVQRAGVFLHKREGYVTSGGISLYGRSAPYATGGHRPSAEGGCAGSPVAGLCPWVRGHLSEDPDFGLEGPVDILEEAAHQRRGMRAIAERDVALSFLHLSEEEFADRRRPPVRLIREGEINLVAPGSEASIPREEPSGPGFGTRGVSVSDVHSFCVVVCLPVD